MFKKILLFIAILATCMCVLAGCGNKYNAELTDSRYENLAGVLTEDFLTENLVYGVYYEAGYTVDDTYPLERTVIISSQEEFEKTLINPGQYSVDFETEMLVIYTFRAGYVRPITLKSIKYDGGTLKINLKMKGGIFGHGDAAQPFQRYLFIKLSRLDVTSVQVELTEGKDRLF